jgi:hypothetical protein
LVVRYVSVLWVYNLRTCFVKILFSSASPCR